MQADLDEAKKTPQSPEDALLQASKKVEEPKNRKIRTVTICDEEKGKCEEKLIPEHIDVEASMPKKCEVKDIVLRDKTVKNVVVCKKE